MAVCAEYRVAHSQFLSWPNPDRDKAVWWFLRRRATCRNCGTRREQWDPALGGDRHAMVARVSRCRGCEVLDSARKNLPKDAGRGVYVELVPNPARAPRGGSDG